MREVVDILICGDLAALDIIFAEYLARRGLRVVVARKVRAGAEHSRNVPEDFLHALDPARIVEFRSAGELLGMARKARVVITVTGAFFWAIRWRWLFRRVLSMPPVINIAAGSDFSELLGDNGAFGRLYRYFSRSCAINLTVPYPHIIKNVLQKKITNCSFLRYPYLLPASPPEIIEGRKFGALRLLHSSHLDFKVNDSGRHRNSSKGNDRFIRALLRALDEGLDAECIMLFRGPDREIAREMTERSRHAHRFHWKDALSREELHREIRDADIVVDQFDVGGLGGIAIEAMALGTPLMTYLHGGCMDVLYPQHPPVINAHTEADIYRQLMTHTDRAGLATLARAAQQWVYAYHSGDSCLGLLMFYYTFYTGQPLVDYGWVNDESRPAAG